jgi:hypothetical protein
MHIQHFIPHVHNLDLTLIALRSTLGTVVEGRVVVIDNSPTEELARVDLPGNPEVLWPPVPLTTAQTMNWMRRVALSRGLQCFGFQHNDGEPYPGTIDALYRMAAERTDPWGVLFSNYDVCCVFNVEAVRLIGEWDWLFFPFYHLDVDYYNRLDAAGYPQVYAGLKCTHHNDASNTIKVNPQRAEAVSAYFDVGERLLRQKWPR